MDVRDYVLEVCVEILLDGVFTPFVPVGIITKAVLVFMAIEIW